MYWLYLNPLFNVYINTCKYCQILSSLLELYKLMYNRRVSSDAILQSCRSLLFDQTPINKKKMKAHSFQQFWVLLWMHIYGGAEGLISFLSIQDAILLSIQDV